MDSANNNLTKVQNDHNILSSMDSWIRDKVKPCMVSSKNDGNGTIDSRTFNGAQGFLLSTWSYSIDTVNKTNTIEANFLAWVPTYPYLQLVPFSHIRDKPNWDNAV